MDTLHLTALRQQPCVLLLAVSCFLDRDPAGSVLAQWPCITSVCLFLVPVSAGDRLILSVCLELGYLNVAGIADSAIKQIM